MINEKLQLELECCGYDLTKFGIVEVAGKSHPFDIETGELLDHIELSIKQYKKGKIVNPKDLEELEKVSLSDDEKKAVRYKKDQASWGVTMLKDLPKTQALQVGKLRLKVKVRNSVYMTVKELCDTLSVRSSNLKKSLDYLCKYRVLISYATYRFQGETRYMLKLNPSLKWVGLQSSYLEALKSLYNSKEFTIPKKGDTYVDYKLTDEDCTFIYTMTYDPKYDVSYEDYDKPLYKDRRDKDNDLLWRNKGINWKEIDLIIDEVVLEYV